MPPLKDRQSHDLDEEIETIVKESVEEMEEDTSFEEFEELEKELEKLKELPPKAFTEIIDNRVILDSISVLSNQISLFINRDTIKINAENSNENIVIKKLTSIKGDTLDLNSKSLKIRIIELSLWVLVGVCIGFLDNHWLPYIESNIGGAIKWVANIWMKL